MKNQRKTLDDWLEWQSNLHHSEIDLGLDRLREVYKNLNLPAFNCPVVSIAGTNGKGSCSAMLESILQQAGYRVGRFSSPHIHEYNERICVDSVPVSDAAIIDSFAQIDAARADVSLTYFEFGTLAAFCIFASSELDVILLEVGMGGRLDAVNIIDADVALITNIALDHQAYLGDTRELIAVEKAGIMRHQHSVVINDPDPPRSLFVEADKLGAEVKCLGRDYQYSIEQGSWKWSGTESESGASLTRSALPLPSLSGAHQLMNAAGVLQVLECLSELPSYEIGVTQQDIRKGLLQLELAARCQIIPGDITQIIDVAHNPDSCQKLADTIRSYGVNGTVHAVFSCLDDKALAEMLEPFEQVVTNWSISELDEPRAKAIANIREGLLSYWSEKDIQHFSCIEDAYKNAVNCCKCGDTIVIFGSFITVAQLRLLRL